MLRNSRVSGGVVPGARVAVDRRRPGDLDGSGAPVRGAFEAVAPVGVRVPDGAAGEPLYPGRPRCGLGPAQQLIRPGSIRQFPDLHGVGSAGSRQPLSVGTERYSAIGGGLAASDPEEFSGVGGISHPGPCSAARGHPLAVRAERDTPDVLDVPGESRDFLAGVRVPDLDAVI